MKLVLICISTLLLVVVCSGFGHADQTSIGISAQVTLAPYPPNLGVNTEQELKRWRETEEALVDEAIRLFSKTFYAWRFEKASEDHEFKMNIIVGESEAADSIEIELQHLGPDILEFLAVDKDRELSQLRDCVCSTFKPVWHISTQDGNELELVIPSGAALPKNALELFPKQLKKAFIGNPENRLSIEMYLRLSAPFAQIRTLPLDSNSWYSPSTFVRGQNKLALPLGFSVDRTLLRKAVAVGLADASGHDVVFISCAKMLAQESGSAPLHFDFFANAIWDSRAPSSNDTGLPSWNAIDGSNWPTSMTGTHPINVFLRGRLRRPSIVSPGSGI